MWLSSQQKETSYTHELLDSIPIQKSLMAFVYLIISFVCCSALTIGLM